VRLALAAAALVAIPTAAPAAERDPQALLDRLEASWKAHDVEAYLGLWRPETEAERGEERAYALESWMGEESRLELDRPGEMPRGAFKIAATITDISEPRARVEQAVFTITPGAGGWVIADRQSVSGIDGLVHLSLGPGYRADGLVLRMPDFELQFHHGWLFTPPTDLGPTALVFVGEGTVRVTPSPATEKEQLRQFCGRPELVETVKAAFVRIHPADLHHVLTPNLVEPDPRAEEARAAAQRVFRDHADDTYELDAHLPRSPWWLVPSVGDGIVTFESRRGNLTFAVSHSQPEGVSLFDRARKRQICLYPLAGASGRYDEDAEREVDVLHHDLSVRFDPDRFGVIGTDVMRLEVRQATTTIRLRLDEALRVVSIRSPEGGDHLFFRVRHQDSVMVSLGPLSGKVGEITLTIRYAGALPPMPIDREAAPQLITPPPELEEIVIEEALLYSNLSPWYPQGETDDYATADLRFDVPSGYLAVAGGTQSSLRTESGRTRVEYRQDRPGKYITVVVGRLVEAGRRTDSVVPLTAWAAPRLRTTVEGQLAQAAAILAFYTSEFGPCPYPSLNVVLSESRTPGGHSPPGMIVISVRPALMRNALRDDPASFPDLPDFFIAHELAHQWWGDGVSGQNYHERWISEAFAQYAAALWVRHSRGEEALRNMLERMGRWALRYAGKGPISLGHRLGHIEGDPQVYRAVVYDKGAYVLHMLRQIVGEDAFRRAEMALQSSHRFQKIGTDEIRAALEKESGLDLRPYFEEWVYGTRVPELRLFTRSHPGAPGYRTEITVRGADLPGPVPLEVAVAHAAGTEVRTVSLPPEGGSWTVETPGPPRHVDVNGSRGLLARIRRD
jgi:hypothetical protein